MSELKLKIYNSKFQMLAASLPGNDVSLVYGAAYEDGDFILLESDPACKYCVVQLEDSMSPTFVYVGGERAAFHIPSAEHRKCYSPKSFAGHIHVIRARTATQEEILARRNLALNPYDTTKMTNLFPHASADVEAQDETFAPRNAIDGMLENNSHGSWPYQAWGINKSEAPTFRLDFGRRVTADEVRLTLRADFPHDSWWTSAVLRFSDGSQETVQLQRTGKTQAFHFEPHSFEWLELCGLQKANDTSIYPALTQIEVYGTEAAL